MIEKPIRILTAVAAYDGHDASVLALNRALLAGQVPVEVIYMGFNMASRQIATAAIQEGVDAVAVSSYNGGHLQFFPHLIELLSREDAGSVMVFGGGGGTIIAADAASLEASGVEKIYGPGWPLDAIAADMTRRIAARAHPAAVRPDIAAWKDRKLSTAEAGSLLAAAEHATDAYDTFFANHPGRMDGKSGRVIVVAGGGGSGKSTLIDELVRRFLNVFAKEKVAILANDPTIFAGRAPTAFLADRVRMNHIYDARVWLRSLATGSAYAPISPALPRLIRVFQSLGYSLILVETPGTGQTGLDLGPLQPDLLVYIQTCEYGDSLQLQKDQLLHRADLVVLNKADLEGAEAAFAEIRTALSGEERNETLFPVKAKAARDPGIDSLFAAICRRLNWRAPQAPRIVDVFRYAKTGNVVPHHRRAYLAEIANKVRSYDFWTANQLRLIRENPGDLSRLDPVCARLLEEWQNRWRDVAVKSGGATGSAPEVVTPNGLKLPKVALPDPEDRVDSLRFLLEEGLPGQFPFTTGIYPFRRSSAVETIRQFAGLRGPEATNRRLHFLTRGIAKPRLSVAFDGVTLYGADSDEDPGSIGKIGEGGVAIDTWEDMKMVFDGFRIPDISTSMTINGPAPVILAMYFVAAEEIELERAAAEKGQPLTAEERETIRKQIPRDLRGTIQADILKEVQAQNESIFQPDFALRLLGDMQEWFLSNGIKKFYSVSISGYHIGEAGASPVQEIAFTLANGFTYVENYRARGMDVNQFARNLSFFFRVSHEAEWLAYGAVCRKIWAIALRDVYGADEDSQRFKFHTQTSGRALQTEEWDTLNPVRLTYHALLGLLANTNSLHVDSADEPMTTPQEKWVHQATMIPNYLREEAEGFVIQNLLSGSYAFRLLMREVQKQVLEEFDRLDQLGGVGPATERGYQRHCIAEHSERYERERRRKTPEYSREPVRRIVGYNIFELPDGHPDKYPAVGEVIRPTPADWDRQLNRLRDFRERHREDAPIFLARLKEAALSGGNVFGELLETVRHATLGQITRTLAEVGGRYRKMV
jgi:methylmalonyl-CoA mutase